MPGLLAKLCPCLIRSAVLERAQRINAATNKEPTTSRVEYASKGALLSPAEYAFFRVLSKLCKGRGVFIAVQVRLLDVLMPPQGPERQAAMNRVQSKHLDFVICDARSSSIIAAIELDDSSHSRKKRQERDTFLDEAMASAGIPLHREKTAIEYDETRLYAVLESLVVLPGDPAAIAQ